MIGNGCSVAPGAKNRARRHDFGIRRDRHERNRHHFSNIHDFVVPELTRRRAIASIPFGGRYRLIDFELSNMVNSDITKVGVITNYNYQSLMDHIGTGKDWDLARRSGGIKLLPPFITAYDSNKNELMYSSRLELLKGALSFIARSSEEYVVLTDCDRICNMDYQKF